MIPLKILMVEDHELQRRVYRQFVEAGFPSTSIDAVEKPLAQIEDYDPYDGVMLDLYMADGSNTLELAHRLNNRNWRRPLWLLTGAEHIARDSLVPDYRPFWWATWKGNLLLTDQTAYRFIRACAATKKEDR